MFPSPLEVDRFISVGYFTNTHVAFKFPSPLEVDRFISVENCYAGRFAIVFPSPLEVDRFISWVSKIQTPLLLPVSVPSRGG